MFAMIQAVPPDSAMSEMCLAKGPLTCMPVVSLVAKRDKDKCPHSRQSSLSGMDCKLVNNRYGTSDWLGSSPSAIHSDADESGRGLGPSGAEAIDK